MTTAQLQQILLDQGYTARIDDDGDILFEARNRPAYVTILEQEPAFVIFFLDVQTRADEGSKAVLLQGCNFIQCVLKGVKCLLLRQDEEGYLIRMAIECFADAALLSRCATRSIDSLCEAATMLVDAVERAAPLPAHAD